MLSCLWLLAQAGAWGETRYVDVSNPSPSPPYTNWATAATSIQDAADIAMAGDEIVVTNGAYQTGARAVYGMSNRLAVTKPVAVRSVNGPAVTQIVGYQVLGTTNGPAAVRCVYLTNGAVLAGFTLTNGATQTAGYPVKDSGGGMWCEGPSALASNCVLTGNSAYGFGGGVFQGTLNNCTLTGNSADYGGGTDLATVNYCTLAGNSAIFGGGASDGTLHNCTLTGNSASYEGGGTYASTLNNCTLTGNSAFEGGGTYSGTLNNSTVVANSASYEGGGTYEGTLTNCIIYYNRARYSDANYKDCILNYCCTTPVPAGGTGNLVEEPELASVSHLSAGSRCRGLGSAAYSSGVDIDGEPWANPPSIGCDEYWSGSVTGALSVAVVAAFTNVAVGFETDFQAVIGGRVNGSRWDFGDGNIVSNRPWASHAWAVAGDYVVELRAYNESYPAGVASTVTVRIVPQPVHYVALTNSNPVSPYTNWATAATNIQDAVDTALPGALVWVSDGAYQAGARAVYGMSNRLAMTKPLAVQSVNGSAVTQIVGYQMPETTNGAAAVRCAYLTNGAVLAGFTLTNGATESVGSGGAVWCEGLSAVVSNCAMVGNSAALTGGGAYFGTLDNCTLTANSAIYGGGAYYGTLNNCVLAGNSARDSGGGAEGGALNNCVLTGNSVGNYGGGAYSGTLNNCVLTSNSAIGGGGAFSGTLNSCTLTGNSAEKYGGAAYLSTLNNCVLAGNSAGGSGGGAFYGTLNDCTLTGNAAWYSGGGADSATLTNCIVYYNSARSNGPNCSLCTLNYCCTTPLPPGPGNLTNAPVFVYTNGWSNLRLQSNSPCIGAGTNAYAIGDKDLDGRPRIVGQDVDMGAFEYQGAGMSEFIAWLQQYGLPADGSADTADSDGDGLNNWQEWRAGTDPTNAISVLRLLIPLRSGADLSISWQSAPGRSYLLERCSDLGTVSCYETVGAHLPSQGTTTVYTHTNAAGGGPWFYRVAAE